MSKLLALFMSAVMAFGGAAPAVPTVSHDAVVNSRAELHLSDEEVNFRTGDVVRLTVEPAASAQPLGWEVQDVTVSNDALRLLDNDSPEAEAKREELRHDSQTVGNPDNGQLVVYLLALRSGSAKVSVNLQNAFFPQETLSLTVETKVSGAISPPPTDTSGGGYYPDGPTTKPEQPDPGPSVSPDPEPSPEPSTPVDPEPTDPVDPDPGPSTPVGPTDPDDPECSNAANHDSLHLGQSCPGCDVIGTAPHSFGAWTVIVHPTTDTVGEAQRVCDCGATETREIPQLLVFDEQAWAPDLSGTSFTYNGTAQTPLWNLDGLPEGITATITYFDADGKPVEHPTHAGTYTYTVKFDVSSTYAPVDNVTGGYTIDPATLTLKHELDENGQVSVVLDGLVEGDVIGSTTSVSNSVVNGEIVGGTTTSGPIDATKNDYSIVSTEVNLTEGGNYVISDADRTTIYQTQTTPETSWFNIEAQIIGQPEDGKVVVAFVLKDLKTNQFAQHSGDVDNVSGEHYNYTKFSIKMNLGYGDAIQSADMTDYLSNGWGITMPADGKTITANHTAGLYDNSSVTLCTVTFDVATNEDGQPSKDILLTIDSTLHPDDSDTESLPFEYKSTSSVLVINPSGDIKIVEVPVEGNLTDNATYTGPEDDEDAKKALQGVIDGLDKSGTPEADQPEVSDTSNTVIPEQVPAVTIPDTTDEAGTEDSSIEETPAEDDQQPADQANSASDDSDESDEVTDATDLETDDTTESETPAELPAAASTQPAVSDSAETLPAPATIDTDPALQPSANLGLAA